MKKLLVGLMVFGLSFSAFADTEDFQCTMTLLAQLAILESQALSFPETEAGTAQAVAVAATDGTAAIFTATGAASDTFQASVVDINMTDGSTTIAVNTWTFGGGFAVAGTGAFDGSGNAVNLRVGATANVLATNAAGAYSGTATLTVVYN